MRTAILIIAAISVLTSLALSQDTIPLPPTTIVGAGFARGTQDSIGKVHEGASAANPFFCPPITQETLTLAARMPTGCSISIIPGLESQMLRYGLA